MTKQLMNQGKRKYASIELPDELLAEIDHTVHRFSYNSREAFVQEALHIYLAGFR